MTLLEEIKAKCSPELLASGDHQAIADAVNVGRVKPAPTRIGEGKILEVLGLAAGNAFLDVIDNGPDFRHVKKIVARGDFDMSTPVSQAGVDAMVPVGVLTQEHADLLKALGTAPDPISEFDVRRTLYAEDGTFLG